MKYGIELEFFVHNSKRILVPAIEATYNTDGNPIIGEVRTKVCDSLTDCVFELQKLLYLERKALSKKGYTLVLATEARVSDVFLKEVRSKGYYADKKEALKLFSIYGKSTGKILGVRDFKASLQINISSNRTIYFDEYNKLTKKMETKHKICDEVFEFPTIIRNLDVLFKKDIKDTNRVPGVYAIKEGQFGKRIENRSLPNNIDLDKLLTYDK